jgi:hypothetical protein
MRRAVLFAAIAEAEAEWRHWWALWCLEPDHRTYYRIRAEL